MVPGEEARDLKLQRLAESGVGRALRAREGNLNVILRVREKVVGSGGRAVPCSGLCLGEITLELM